MPTDQALSLCPQTKLSDELNHDKDSYSVPKGFWDQGFWGEGSESIKIIQKVNDELDHDKDLYSVPTGFWDQGYWGERSTESTKKIQIKRSAACIKSIQMAEGPGAELPDDLPTAQCEKNLHDSAPARRYRHGSRGRKVRYSQLCAPFAPHRQPFTTSRFAPLFSASSSPSPKTAPRSV